MPSILMPSARFIVVFDDICLESAFLRLELGAENDLAPRFKIECGRIVPAVFAVLGDQMRAKVKHGGKMTVLSDKFDEIAFFHVKYFANRECIVFLEGVFF